MEAWNSAFATLRMPSAVRAKNLQIPYTELGRAGSMHSQGVQRRGREQRECFEAVLPSDDDWPQDYSMARAPGPGLLAC